MKNYLKQKEAQEVLDIQEFDSVVDIWDKIEELLEKEPDGRRKEWKSWQEEINNLITICNKKCGFKVYKKV